MITTPRVALSTKLALSPEEEEVYESVKTQLEKAIQNFDAMRNGLYIEIRLNKQSGPPLLNRGVRKVELEARQAGWIANLRPNGNWVELHLDLPNPL